VILTFWASWWVPGCASSASAWVIRTTSLGAECCRGFQFPGGPARKFQRAGLRSHLAAAVSFTIDRAGRLAEHGRRLEQPGWTPERLAELVTPVLRG
jgi:hypothetical protein